MRVFWGLGALCLGGLICGCGGNEPSLEGPRTLAVFDDAEGGAIAMRTDGSGQRLVDDVEFTCSMDDTGRIYTSNLTVGLAKIYSMKQDGTNKVQLTSMAGDDIRPCVTPDGSMIAFTSDRDGNLEIYVVDGNGGTETRLTNNAAEDNFPAISKDGTKVVFMSERDGNQEIYSIHTDGTGLTRLTNDGSKDTTPAWTPDGTQIVFSSNRDGNFEIYRMDADGANPTRLTTTPGGDNAPSYKVDGSAIFYRGANSLFRMNPDGSGIVKIPNTDPLIKISTWVY